MPYGVVLWVAKVPKTTSYWENHSILVYSLNLFKYLGSFLFAALTAQSGGKAPRSDRADPRVWGYAPPYTPADNVESVWGRLVYRLFEFEVDARHTPWAPSLSEPAHASRTYSVFSWVLVWGILERRFEVFGKRKLAEGFGQRSAIL